MFFKMKKKTKISILLMFIATLFISAAQIMFKTAALNMQFEILTIFSELHKLFIPSFLVPVILGFILYGISAILVTFALKNGELSVLYPILATSFIWVMIIAFLIFNESVALINIIGIISIIAGISAIGYGAKI